jgi:hypothetical protein
VITAMRKYQTNAQIQEHRCAVFLQNMSLSAHARSDMIHLKTKMSLVMCAALCNRSRGNQVVPITACDAICNLAAYKMTKSMLIESSTIPMAMIHLLEQKDKMMAKAPCGALLSIVTGSKGGQGAVIWNNGVVIHYIAVMEKFQDSLDLYQIRKNVLEELAIMNIMQQE